MASLPKKYAKWINSNQPVSGERAVHSEPGVTFRTYSKYRHSQNMFLASRGLVQNVPPKCLSYWNTVVFSDCEGRSKLSSLELYAGWNIFPPSQTAPFIHYTTWPKMDMRG